MIKSYRILRWTKSSFDDTPLEDMVYEFNRYNRTTRLTLEGVPPGSHDHYKSITLSPD